MERYTASTITIERKGIFDKSRKKRFGLTFNKIADDFYEIEDVVGMYPNKPKEKTDSPLIVICREAVYNRDKELYYTPMETSGFHRGRVLWFSQFILLCLVKRLYINPFYITTSIGTV